MAVASSPRTPLTLELLQDRLKSPTQQDGYRMVDLRRMVIDLRPEHEDFQAQFYRLLNIQLQQTGLPLGLDLSDSLVQGELDISALGVRVPLYGQTLSPIFSEAEQTQLKRDRRRLSQLSQLSRSLLIQTQAAPLQITVFRGPLRLVQTQFEGFLNFNNTFFLGPIEARGADFTQDVDWSEARFSQAATFVGATFRREARFRSAIFFDRASFNQAQFQGAATFQSSEFQATVNFSQAVFQQAANLTRVQWLGNADFAQVRWQAAALFNKSKFAQSFFLTEATFEAIASFREVQISQPVNLRSASILSQADFGDAQFSSQAYLNISGLQFNAEQARILGDPGQIGRRLSVPTLQGNETLLRNLVRNFRTLEQIPDANQVEYTRERLRLRQLRQRLLGTNLNTASVDQLIAAGFKPQQAEVVMQKRQQQPLRSLSDLLKLDGIDLATYVKVRDRVVAEPPLDPGTRLQESLTWLGLSLLLLLSRYGTSFWLIFGIGMLGIAYFGLLFWLVDRIFRVVPKPTLPPFEEWVWVWGSFATLGMGGISAIFRTAEHAGPTLACLALLLLPIPALLLLQTYRLVSQQSLMQVSYFVEDGSLRQLRLLIGRLPIMPRFAFFRDRYMPILIDRRWNWLNYYDFSLINLLKFGFNDIRLRDEQMPGPIASLVWYQWGLGILYIGLLLWTLSRTIPGLNLLIYFK